MPVKKTPTRVLEARGSFRHKPSRRRDNEPKVIEPLGSPPASLDDAEREAWLDIVSRAPVGVLTAADWQSVALASMLMVEAMTDFKGINAARLSRLPSLLGDFGMTPAARASLSIPGPKEENPFAALDCEFS
jgi:phage terminase small subunit